MDKGLGTYTIKELEVLTGIKAHTIRIWEQRYNILQPNRTQTNIRYYTENDLKHLLNISLLNKNGLKISRIARMSDTQVKDKVLELTETSFEYTRQVDALVVSMVEFDEAAFEKTLSASIRHVGFEETFVSIVFPFLNKLGILWQTAVIKPAHEHFISNLIRQKLIAAIDAQSAQLTGEKKLKHLLFLPEREQHELTLLFTNYLLRARNYRTLYLGTSVPVSDLTEVLKDYSPDFMFTVCVSYPAVERIQAFLSHLAEKFPDTRIIVSGRQTLGADLDVPDNIVVFPSLQEMIAFIDDLDSPKGGGLPIRVPKHASVFTQY